MEISNPTEIKATGHDLEKAVKRKKPAAPKMDTKHTGSVTPAKSFSQTKLGTVEIINPIEIKATGHDLKAVKRKKPTGPKMDMKPTGDARPAKSFSQTEAGTVEMSNPNRDQSDRS